MIKFSYFLIFLIFVGGVNYCSSSKHALVMLLILEFMVLLVFFTFVWYTVGASMYLGMFYLIFSVCEGVLGLSLLVVMSRCFGGDYLSVFSISN